MSPLPSRFSDGNILTAAQLNAFIDYLTGEIGVPSGGTGSRPSSPQNGQLFYNTSTRKLEVYSGAWRDAIQVGSVNLSGVIKPTRTQLGFKNIHNQRTMVNSNIRISSLGAVFGVTARFDNNGRSSAGPLLMIATADIPSVGANSDSRNDALHVPIAGGHILYFGKSGDALLHGTTNDRRILYRLWDIEV